MGSKSNIVLVMVVFIISVKIENWLFILMRFVFINVVCMVLKCGL